MFTPIIINIGEQPVMFYSPIHVCHHEANVIPALESCHGHEKHLFKDSIETFNHAIGLGHVRCSLSFNCTQSSTDCLKLVGFEFTTLVRMTRELDNRINKLV